VAPSSVITTKKQKHCRASQTMHYPILVGVADQARRPGSAEKTENG